MQRGTVTFGAEVSLSMARITLDALRPGLDDDVERPLRS